MSDEPMIMELHGIEFRLFDGEDLYKVKYNNKGKAKWTPIENSVKINNKSYSHDRIRYKMFHGGSDIDSTVRLTKEMYSSLQFMIESNYPSCPPA
tara:strand:+ start:412 stop:696 length:285 start_codon:yes stop_codon:yes gene_type:complete